MTTTPKEDAQEIKKIRAQLLRAAYEKIALQRLLTAQKADREREET